MFCCCEHRNSNKVGERGESSTNLTSDMMGNSQEYLYEDARCCPVSVRGCTGILGGTNRVEHSVAERTAPKSWPVSQRWYSVTFTDTDEEKGKFIIKEALLPRKEMEIRKRKIIGNTKTTTMSNTVPAIGKPAPIFKGTAVVDGQFKEISLEDYKGKYVVFFFYPLDFTFVCPTEIIAFSDRAEEFRNIGCEVVACSTDSHFSHLAWINTPRKEGGLGTMKIPLLADKSMEVAKAYGVLKEDDGVAFRGLFIIDGNQNLRQVTINDLPVGRDVDESLRLVQAFQFTDEHGEVCPAGWKPGAKTMKADPTGSKEYFQNEN